jgi:hypothetical protein
LRIEPVNGRNGTREMLRVEQLELRAGSELWATLSINPDGEKTLDHDLTENKVYLCTGVGVYDSAGRMLNIQLGDHAVYLNTPDGSRKLQLQCGSKSEILDVVDPKNKVQLVTELPLASPGSVGDAPIKNAGRVFNFRWIA